MTTDTEHPTATPLDFFKGPFCLLRKGDSPFRDVIAQGANGEYALAERMDPDDAALVENLLNLAWQDRGPRMVADTVLEELEEIARLFRTDGGGVAFDGEEVADRVREAASVIRDLQNVARRAAIKFRQYEHLHRAKGTPEAMGKAIVNAQMADLCEAGNTPAPGLLGSGWLGAYENLRDHQTQADADGTMVTVSRQALDEILAVVAPHSGLR